MAVIEGTAAAETLQGTDEKDVIYGYGGADTITGWSGGDTIYGGGGNDRITMGDTTHTGGNRAYGGAGNDLIYAGSDRDRLYGGAGDDFIFLGFERGQFKNLFGYGGAGDDRFWVSSYSSATIEGGDGTDSMILMRMQGGAVTVRESGGSWTIVQAADNWYVTSDVVVTATGVENLTLYGSYFDDDVISGAGDDVLILGTGRNYADAGAGNDFVSYLSSGANTMIGGLGDDTLSVGLAGAPYFVVGQDGTADDGMLSEISGFEHYHVSGSYSHDYIALGEGNDMTYRSRGHDTMIGNGGNDTLNGGAGDDQLFGGAGNDVLRGGPGLDALFGGDGDDKLFLNSGAGVAYGGDGNDRIEVGADESTLYGGAGRDKFVVGNHLGQASLVMDFITGEDRIQIRSAVLDDYAGPTGRLAAGMLVFGAADLAGGQFVLTYDGGSDRTHLWWDRDGSSGNLPLQHLLQFDTGAVSIAHSDIVIL